MSSYRGRWSAGPYREGRRWAIKHGASGMPTSKIVRRTRWGARRALAKAWASEASR